MKKTTKEIELFVDAHKSRWAGCTLCPLGKNAFRHVLLDLVNPNANDTRRPFHPDCEYRINIAFMGEAPGMSEDTTGRPFLGKSGQLLRSAIKEQEELLGFKQPYLIFNTLACRPTDKADNDRPPKQSEKITCRPRVLELLAFFRPTVIVCLGNHAFDSMTVAQKGLDYEPTLVKAWHPSYVLRNGGRNSPKYNDLAEAIREGLAMAQLAKRYQQ